MVLKKLGHDTKSSTLCREQKGHNTKIKKLNITKKLQLISTQQKEKKTRNIKAPSNDTRNGIKKQ